LESKINNINKIYGSNGRNLGRIISMKTLQNNSKTCPVLFGNVDTEK
jgi:hypothetical protein